MSTETAALWVVGIVLAIVTIRIAFSFDLTKSLQLRRERSEERLRMLCPHTAGSIEGNGIRIDSLFSSPQKPRATFAGATMLSFTTTLSLKNLSRAMLDVLSSGLGTRRKFSVQSRSTIDSDVSVEIL